MGKFLPQPADLVPMLTGVGLAALLLIAGFYLQRRKLGQWAVLAYALSFPTAYLLTFINLNDAPGYPPLDSTDRGFYVVILFSALAALMGSLDRYWEAKPLSGRIVRAALYFLASCTAVRFLLKNFFELDAEAEFFISFGEWMKVAGVITATGLLVDEITRRRAAYEVAVVAAVMMGALGQALVMKGAAPYLGQFLGAGAITLGIAALLTRIGQLRHLPMTIAPLIVGFITATGLDAMYYALETPSQMSMLLLLAAPALMLLAGLPGLGTLRLRWVKIGIATLPALGMIIFAFFLAIEEPEVVKKDIDSTPNPYEDLDFLK